MLLNFNIAFYTVLLCAEDLYVTTSGLCPPCWKCANIVANTITYFYVAKNIQSYHICQRYMRLMAIPVCDGKSVLSELSLRNFIL